MAFKLQNLSKWSVSFNRIAANQYGYNGATNGVSDDSATILTLGYFDSVANSHLLVNDIIFIVATNGTFFVEVKAITLGVVLLDVIINATPPPFINIVKFFTVSTIPNLDLVQIIPAVGVTPADAVSIQILETKGDTAKVLQAKVETDEFLFEFTAIPTQLQDFQAIIVGVDT